MIKKILLPLALMISAGGVSSAQTSLVATLSHEGNITTFYSANAFKDAYAAAVDGDVVTLSSGNFISPAYIEKNITVRGSGMMLDGDATTITGNTVVQLPHSESENLLTFEGLHFINGLHVKTAVNMSLIKCRLEELYSEADVQNGRIVQCICNDVNSFYNGDWNAVNSYLKSRDISAVNMLKNCVVEMTNSYVDMKGNVSNCIFIGTSDNDYMNSNGITVKNCIYIGPSNRFFTFTSNIIGSGNRSIGGDITAFKENTFYELAEEYKSSWLGTDGMEVGMYGGTLSFDPYPTNPRITKFMVAPKTTADGKLSVDIEVRSN